MKRANTQKKAMGKSFESRSTMSACNADAVCQGLELMSVAHAWRFGEMKCAPESGLSIDNYCTYSSQ